VFFELIRSVFANLLYFALHIGGGQRYEKAYTPEEEAEAFEKYWTCNENEKVFYRNEIVVHNMRLVARIAAKFSKDRISEAEDIAAEGSHGLIKAVAAFKPSHQGKHGKAVKFSSFAATCIENEMLMFLRRGRRTQFDVHFEDTIEEDKDGNTQTLKDSVPSDEDVEAQTEKKINIQKMRVFMREILDQRELEILIMRYGLDNKKPLPQRDVAKMYGISRSYVSRIETKAVCKLRAKFEKSEFSEGLNEEDLSFLAEAQLNEHNESEF
jgi:RNA polymerase sporulation-specific sigma factor